MQTSQSRPAPAIVSRTPIPPKLDPETQFIVMWRKRTGSQWSVSPQTKADVSDLESALAFAEERNGDFPSLYHRVFALVPVELTAPGPVLVEKPRTCICGYPIRRTDEVEIGLGADRVWIHLSGDFSCATPGQYATPAEEGE